MTYDICTIATHGGRLNGVFPEIPGNLCHRFIANEENLFTPCQCYQEMLARSHKDVLIYLHNDLTIHDADWIDRLMHEFETGATVVGFGGAVGLGNADLYRKPFNIWNMARRGYASNQIDAEIHGERFTGVRRVAVLDAFCMAVRADFLRSIGGWPVEHIGHHGLDLWLACESARHQKETRLVGVSVTHHGGGTSTRPEYAKAHWLQGGTLESDHVLPHIWIADQYRDVLPFQV